MLSQLKAVNREWKQVFSDKSQICLDLSREKDFCDLWTRFLVQQRGGVHPCLNARASLREYAVVYLKQATLSPWVDTLPPQEGSTVSNVAVMHVSCILHKLEEYKKELDKVGRLRAAHMVDVHVEDFSYMAEKAESDRDGLRSFLVDIVHRGAILTRRLVQGMLTLFFKDIKTGGHMSVALSIMSTLASYLDRVKCLRLDVCLHASLQPTLPWPEPTPEQAGEVLHLQEAMRVAGYLEPLLKFSSADFLGDHLEKSTSKLNFLWHMHTLEPRSEMVLAISLGPSSYLAKVPTFNPFNRGSQGDLEWLG